MPVMRILIIAYDYPPVLTPRALRWRYLSRELALQGHDVHMLVPDAGDPGVDESHGSGRITVHRTFPGPIGWLAWRRQRQECAGRASNQVPSGPSVTRLNWRGRVLDAIKRLLGLVLFPDVRAEWTPWARSALRRLLKDIEPDVVVTSHEPASTLQLGFDAREAGFPWVADLGDPVCAPYTPPRWRRRALALERRVSALATQVVVTADATRTLLMERHGVSGDRCSVLPNGYDDRRPDTTQDATVGLAFDDGLLELIYAGRLYGYRDPAPLLRAVEMTPDVRLTLVVPDPPASAEVTPGASERIRVLGPMSHDDVLKLEAQADVLVSLGNVNQPAQVPAKVYEYLGIQRPVLHVRCAEVDVVGDLLDEMGRGWQCWADPVELAALLGRLRRQKMNGTLHDGIDTVPRSDFAHSFLGRKLGVILATASGKVPAELVHARECRP
jgi:glycosyltransferase involved in cell wall biosynthesis